MLDPERNRKAQSIFRALPVLLRVKQYLVEEEEHLKAISLIGFGTSLSPCSGKGFSGRFPAGKETD
jgi:hypothetical protein